MTIDLQQLVAEHGAIAGVALFVILVMARVAAKHLMRWFGPLEMRKLVSIEQAIRDHAEGQARIEKKLDGHIKTTAGDQQRTRDTFKELYAKHDEHGRKIAHLEGVEEGRREAKHEGTLP